MECHGCGLCCRGLFIAGMTHEEISVKLSSDPVSGDFIKDHWKPISDELGRQRAFWIQSGGTYAFFECEYFDKETNLCKCYECRPWICRGYPFYKGLDISKENLPPGCGYGKGETKMGVEINEEEKVITVHDSIELLELYNKVKGWFWDSTLVLGRWAPLNCVIVGIRPPLGLPIGYKITIENDWTIVWKGIHTKELPGIIKLVSET